MSEQNIAPGASQPTIRFFVLDDDAPRTVTATEPGLTIRYRRSANGKPVTASWSSPISLANLGSVDASYSSGGIIVLDATTGEHRLDLPTAAVADGATELDLDFAATDTGLVFLLAGPITIGYSEANVVQWSGTVVADSSGGNIPAQVVEMGSGVLTAAAIAANAITAAKIAAGALNGKGDWSTADKVLAYFQLLARSDSEIVVDRAVELAEINADEGSGAPMSGYAPDNDALQALEGNLQTIITATQFLPAGQASILAKLLAYVQLLARKDSAIATDKAAELAEINANEGSGAGGYDNEDDAQQAIRDRGDTSWSGGGGGAVNVTTEATNITSETS